MSNLESYQNELIEQAMSVGALKFGSFVLKSGRVSPYFINAGLMNTGPILATLADAYANTVAGAFPEDKVPFDVLFGPAYKGIPFAAVTALALHTQHKRDVGFAYDRKEAKDHGEGGKTVGAPLAGRRVLVLDDVMTSGKAVREAIGTVQAAGGEVVGVVQLLDREEIGQGDARRSTVTEIEELVGAGRVRAILQMRDLMAWLESKGMSKELAEMRDYRDKYGLKA
ncbi:phosphoribosyltransferase-like protein [Schizophyllum amplum]|uniref:orotate phosphoribosyltransferase n=1 Tax=Schizophyllum amplum TaxID=97359 RepID=A0A550CS55_9AGAR|nr:phosphoribosyltransferase-like protein [Auriculariopsis ampla]